MSRALAGDEQCCQARGRQNTSWHAEASSSNELESMLLGLLMLARSCISGTDGTTAGRLPSLWPMPASPLLACPQCASYPPLPAAPSPLPVQAKESRTFFSRLFALFGGREEVARLVRTASFRWVRTLVALAQPAGVHRSDTAAAVRDSAAALQRQQQRIRSSVAQQGSSKGGHLAWRHCSG